MIVEDNIRDLKDFIFLKPLEEEISSYQSSLYKMYKRIKIKRLLFKYQNLDLFNCEDQELQKKQNYEKLVIFIQGKVGFLKLNIQVRISTIFLNFPAITSILAIAQREYTGFNIFDFLGLPKNNKEITQKTEVNQEEKEKKPADSNKVPTDFITNFIEDRNANKFIMEPNIESEAEQEPSLEIYTENPDVQINLFASDEEEKLNHNKEQYPIKKMDIKKIQQGPISYLEF